MIKKFNILINNILCLIKLLQIRYNKIKRQHNMLLYLINYLKMILHIQLIIMNFAFKILNFLNLNNHQNLIKPLSQPQKSPQNLLLNNLYNINHSKHTSLILKLEIIKLSLNKCNKLHLLKKNKRRLNLKKMLYK